MPDPVLAAIPLYFRYVVFISEEVEQVLHGKACWLCFRIVPVDKIFFHQKYA